MRRLSSIAKQDEVITVIHNGWFWWFFRGFKK
jgi:hypothetical protein